MVVARIPAAMAHVARILDFIIFPVHDDGMTVGSEMLGDWSEMLIKIGSFCDAA
jgi:hypothetical protein